MNSEQLTDFAYFKVFDFNQQLTLSAYCLEITPLTFVPRIPSTLNQKKLVWNFGDNTTSTELTATHAYSAPGKYTVNLIVYDCSNQSRVASYDQDIQVYDYLPNTIALSSSNLSACTFKSGAVSNPILVTQYTPWYQSPPTIFYSVSGSGATNYFNLSADKFNHLRSYNAIVDHVYLPGIAAYEYQEIDKLVIPAENIYVRTSGSSIVKCNKGDAGSTFAGTSGSKIVYYKDDAQSDLVLIHFFLDKSNIQDNQGLVDYYNNLGVTLSASISYNTPSYLSMTSTGLDGEGQSVNSFDIAANKFTGLDIPFVIKLKDSNAFTVKTAPSLQLSALDIRLIGYNSANTLVSYNRSSSGIVLSAIEIPYNTRGSMRGYLRYEKDVYGLRSAYMRVSAVVVDDSSSSYNLSGISSTFNIYPQTVNNIYKKGEDFDMTESFKSLRFQEIYLDKEVFFDDFIGSIFGTISSNFDTLGKKIYERIHNFIDNNQYVDRVEISPLLSILDEIDSTYTTYNTASYPNLVNRALSLLSINRNRLVGYPNQFDLNFDSKDHINSSEFGTNLGSRVDTLSYVVSAGTDLVAYERFNGRYDRLNSLQPLSSGNISIGTNNSYALSSVNGDWGWPLVLPDQYTPQDIDKYYNFYAYVGGTNNTMTDGVVDFSNTQTTLLSTVSLSSFNADNGVIENILCNTLYSSLSLYNIYTILAATANPGYRRPGGVSSYYRPDGSSIYIRP